jgi:hypothetical protein
VVQTGFTIGAIWNQRALTDAPLTAEKLAMVASRVMAVCDRTDGLVDGTPGSADSIPPGTCRGAPPVPMVLTVLRRSRRRR